MKICNAFQSQLIIPHIPIPRLAAKHLFSDFSLSARDSRVFLNYHFTFRFSVLNSAAIRDGRNEIHNNNKCITLKNIGVAES